MNEILDYYRAHSPITDPGKFVHLYQELPDDIPKVIDIIQGQLLHRLAAEQFGVTLTRQSRGEQRLRTMQQRLARIAELDPSPLATIREPKERQVGVCRDFAVFLTSILRHKAIPARMRVGFAEYIKPDSPFKGDHWITEYWDETQSRWVLADADVVLVDIQRDEQFYSAGAAWNLARAGTVRSDLFRFSGRWKGFPCIRGNLLHDFQALNKLELGVFDYWDDLHTKAESALSVDDKAILDRIAELSDRPEENFEDLRNLFNELPRTQRIYAKLRQLGVLDDIELARIDELKPSGKGRLAELTTVEMPEAVTIAKQMDAKLAGKTIASFGRGNKTHKFLWLIHPEENYFEILPGLKITSARNFGRSIYLHLGDHMLWWGDAGGKILYHAPGEKPPKNYHLEWTFMDGSALTYALQMWGTVKLLDKSEFGDKPNDDIGTEPLSPEFSFEKFNQLLEEYPEKTSKGIKGFLVATGYAISNPIHGLGNAIVQDTRYHT